MFFLQFGCYVCRPISSGKGRAACTVVVWPPPIFDLFVCFQFESVFCFFLCVAF